MFRSVKARSDERDRTHRLIGLIRRIRYLDLRLRVSSILSSGLCHPFAESTFFDEVAFETADLLIKEIIRLVNKADSDIGNDLE